MTYEDPEIQKSAVAWHDTTGDPDWRKKLEAFSMIDMPSSIPSNDWNLNTYEDELFRAALNATRHRQNGEYPGDAY